MKKKFKIAVISSNKNSFGLNQFIFMAQDGKVWTACRSREYSPFKEGDVLSLEEDVSMSLAMRGFEIPHPFTDAPKNVVQEIWGN